MTVTRFLTLTALLCAAPLAGVAGTNDDPEAAATSQQKSCCFENPRYSGTCEVTPGPEESCGDILAYLNNPNSVGKSYCGNTKVRGGWSQVACGGAAASGSSCTAPADRE
jgi:hypothetical protein